jgi:hypothetical protein
MSRRGIALVILFAVTAVACGISAPTLLTPPSTGPVADGGDPVPPSPWSASLSSVVVADGGDPVPPSPWSANRSAVLVADGGDPVPPSPWSASQSTVLPG